MSKRKITGKHGELDKKLWIFWESFWRNYGVSRITQYFLFGICPEFLSLWDLPRIPVSLGSQKFLFLWDLPRIHVSLWSAQNSCILIFGIWPEFLYLWDLSRIHVFLGSAQNSCFFGICPEFLYLWDLPRIPVSMGSPRIPVSLGSAPHLHLKHRFCYEKCRGAEIQNCD